jgi:prepilin-type N-terminal cleavage/methylation domain-containing protein
MSTRRPSDDRGYTLVEFAVAMGIFLIFMSVVTPFMFSQIQGALRTEDRVDLQQNARIALRTMTRELRQATELYDSVDKPSGKTEVSFGLDFDGNGVIDSYNNTAAPLEQITYYYTPVDETLYRGRKVNFGSPLAEHVQDVNFTMYGSNLVLDGNGDGVVDEDELDTNGNNKIDGPELANVTRLTIELDMAGGDVTQTFEAQAFMRNRVVG